MLRRLMIALAIAFAGSNANAATVIQTGTVTSFFAYIVGPDSFTGPTSVTVELFGGNSEAEIYDNYYTYYDYYADFGDGWQNVGGNDYDYDTIVDYFSGPGKHQAIVNTSNVYNVTYYSPTYYEERLVVHTARVGIYNYEYGRPLEYRVTFHGIVPEPSTWALMIMGFGATGAMLRRRHANA
ncbi:MAG: PEP-CTERM sorting domain-containing protein [Phenylobacterium sp.]|uniref:PEPxxWA-CTERM sorting domain-containing protein n=1 Tax=Phenylobacterium sp. TaxID=1871053 RepID=UPI001A361ABB|nr:PEPxxWA-CTERM sorting domain-containing protein [Phenylobacterium sp.]MBJ7408885.1 PEP-CTERM sorting domain-containing protein [Phenylobacterium sp.]